MSECIQHIQLMQRPMKGGSKRVIDRIGAKRRKETEQSGQVKVQGRKAWAASSSIIVRLWDVGGSFGSPGETYLPRDVAATLHAADPLSNVRSCMLRAHSRKNRTLS